MLQLLHLQLRLLLKEQQACEVWDDYTKSYQILVKLTTDYLYFEARNV